ncbi:aminodeoxychorismate/anthranilate synthase component II [Buchnera aphidicola (Therioaphis trifolii)]|uniref:anthranilate synthase n=1 Tax=Buchnera aphidicola (Therioaphis trifolii) TaxID=1241884 RepID=A0A4D6YBT8_9GAMM|nr:aminodeoxychorismate/anthranilate synthase component II [Buchnera aphidicola (Therioaphis trifolii)]
MYRDILLIDNFDSFTYNIVDQLRCTGNNVIIYRNNISINIILSRLLKLKNPIILLSPGPGKPEHSGCMLHLLKLVIGKIPIIGICLGHQAIVQYYGGTIGYADKILHGKTSYIYHDQKAMFSNFSSPLLVARYHSLICKNISKKLIINAISNNMVMAVRNDYDKVCGFQFHPESILTTYGFKLLNDTLNWLNN